MSIRGSLRAVLLLALGAILTAPAFASIHHPGKWSIPVRWTEPGTSDTLKETAVNMSLLALPDSNGQTRARVIWWQDDHEHDAEALPDSVFGGLLDWRPASDSLLNSGAFPDVSPTTGTLRPFRYPSPGYNIFCSGMSQLEEDQGWGRLLVAGGTIEAENGSPLATVYNARTNSWTRTASMLETGRWYPSLTTLPGGNGRTLITSGSRYREGWLFGGGVDTAGANDNTLYRSPFSHDAGVQWNASLVPEQDVSSEHAGLPLPRRGHTATNEIGGTQAFYGGQRLDDGQLLEDFWMLRKGDNPDQPDYKFNWEKRTPNTGTSPGKRAYHTAAVLAVGDEVKLETLILVGGQKFLTWPGATTNQVWSGRLINKSWKIDWRRLDPTPDSEVLPPRFGHAQVWEPGLKRLFVYGGAAEPNQLPSDPDVYSMEIVSADNDTVLDNTYVRWRKCTVQNPDTVPRPRAFMASGSITRNLSLSPTSNRETTGLLIYGGRTPSGTPGDTVDVVSDSMYVLWPISQDVVRWTKVPQTGSHPAVEYASGTATDNLEEFWVLGGKDAGGTAQQAMFSAALHCKACGADTLVAKWSARASASHPVWGHTFPTMGYEIFARTTELYDPVSTTFSTLTGAHRALDWYPHVFTVPGAPNANTVFVTGPQQQVWKLGLSGSGATWTTVHDDTTKFRGGSSVMYRPGRVMKCGSRDTDGNGVAIGTTKTMNLTMGSPTWSISDAMRPRVNHNLVLLPDGKVLAVGGTAKIDNRQNQLPQGCPEIWDPVANDSTGAWEGADGVGMQLDTSGVARGYHSTALLLPDGRVLCSGGNATDKPTDPYHTDQWKTDLYSPPYLFKADGTNADRPDLRTAPRRVSYGQEFVVSVAGIDSIMDGCLIRAGAVTHGFDESQRYIPLAFTRVGPADPNTRYYLTAAPTDSAVAPPGDYLLFVRNDAGTPGIARWLRISRTNSGIGKPTRVTNLSRECANGPVVALRWTAPGSDVGNPVLTRVTKYAVRYSTSAMTSDGSGDSLAAPDPGQPLADTDHLTTPALTVGQTYYFRLRAKNANSGSGNWSDWSNQVSWVVHDEECGGSGGGGGGPMEDGGNSAQRAAVGRLSATYRRPGGAGPDSTFLENTLLPNVGLGTTRRDRVRLPFGPRWTEAGARVRLSRTGTRSTHFEQVRLLAVDYGADEGVFVRGGELVAGATHDPVRVVHADGRDLTEQFLTGAGFEGREGDTLYVEFGQESPGSLLLSTSRAHLVRAPDRTGIDLACESAQGWTAVGHHEVREHSSDEVFDTPGLHRVRLAFRGVHWLEGVARFTPGTPPVVTAYEPVAAEHSRLGAVAEGLAAGDGATLASGDQLLADFAAGPAPDGTPRAWYLEVTGAHMEAGGGMPSARLAHPGEALPAVFALSRARPNPFAGSTTLGFDVPRRTHVRLEVFDVLGRRVATLADRDYAPGRFTLLWDGRTSAGTTARAGVYLCRMTAGAFRTQQHLVLVK